MTDIQIGTKSYSKNTEWISSGTGQRKKCFEEGQKLGCEFYVSRQCELHGYWERGYTDWENYLKTDFKINGTDYEVIHGTCRFFVDFDLSWSADYSVVQRTIDLILAQLPEGAKVLWIGTSHKKNKKKSYHVIFNVWTQSISIQKQFFEDLKSEIKNSGKNIDLLSADKNGGFVIDMGVYTKTRLFRMYGQTKLRENRPFESYEDFELVEFQNTLVSHVDEEDIEYVTEYEELPIVESIQGDVEELVELLKETFEESHELQLFLKNDFTGVKITDNDHIVLESAANGYCLTKHQDSSHGPSINITQKCIFSGCFSAKCRKKKKWKIETPEVISKYVKSQLTHVKVPYIPDTDDDKPVETADDKPVICGNKIIMQTKHCCAFQFSDRLSVEPYERKRCPYVAHIPKFAQNEIERSTVVLSLGMGSGKTFSFAEFLRPSLDRELKALIISARISYTNDVISDLQRYGIPFVSYQAYRNTSELRQQKRVVCQVDSIPKLDLNQVWDVVFLDEIQTFISHFASPQLKKVDNVAQKCERIIRTCKQLVVADADYNNYSDRSKKILRSMRPGPIYEISSQVTSDECEYIPVKGNECLLLLENLLEEGKKVIVAANTSSFIQKVEKRMGKFPEKTYRVFTADNPYDDRIDKSELAALDVIAYSPTVGPGVSFDFPFDCVLFHFKNSVKAAKLRFSIQMIHRCRQITDKKVYFSLQGKPITKYPLDRDSIERTISEHADDYAHYQKEYCRDLKTVQPFMRFGENNINNPWVQAWIDTEMEDRESLHHFKNIFYDMITKRGGKITKSPARVLPSKRDPIEEPKENANVTDEYPFDNIPFIDKSTHKQIKKKQESLRKAGSQLSHEQDIMLRKYAFFTRNGIPRDTNIDIVKKYYRSLNKMGIKLKNFRNLLTDRKVFQTWDKFKMVDMSSVRYTRLDCALKLIGFKEGIFDRGSYHACPDTIEGYIDLKNDSIVEFMSKEELKPFKGDIRKYINTELRKCVLGSINDRSGTKGKKEGGKRKTYPKWSLHCNSGCAKTFETMCCYLYRQREYLDSEDYLKGKINWDEVKEFTNGRYLLDENFPWIQQTKKRKRE
jgi:hypothetical protein